MQDEHSQNGPTTRVKILRHQGPAAHCLEKWQMPVGDARPDLSSIHLSSDACSMGAHGRTSRWTEVDIIKWRGPCTKKWDITGESKETEVGIPLNVLSPPLLPRSRPYSLGSSISLMLQRLRLPSLGIVYSVGNETQSFMHASFWDKFLSSSPVALKLLCCLGLELWASCLNFLDSWVYRPAPLFLRRTLSF